MTGNEVIESLKKKFRVQNDKELAHKVGVTVAAISQWKNRNECTPRQVAGLIEKARNSGAKETRRNAIRPLVEFYKIELKGMPNGKSYELFDTSDQQKRENPYLLGLKSELKDNHGVYLFFDSRGQAIYAGKAAKQSLWKEMNLALNRQRPDVQQIYRVRHPARRQRFRTNDELARQIRAETVRLWALAAYFSAYRVEAKMIGDVEALLVRSFANDLLNKRMEQFSRNRRAQAEKKRAARMKVPANRSK